MIVRRAKQEHTDAIRKLYETSFPADGPFKRWQRDAMFWVVLDGAQVVGFAGMRYWKDKKVAELILSAVRPSHQGRGLQRRLIAVRERAARKAGMTRAVSYTVTANAPSAANLAKSGYTTYRPPEFYAGKKIVYWEKRL